MASESAAKTFTGGCHCGFIRYSLDVDMSTAELTKCNCSICLKLNLIALDTAPPAKFTLQSPASLTDPGIGDYRHTRKFVGFYFCKECSVNCFYGGSFILPGTEKEASFFKVNVVTLDPDQGLDLTKLKIVHWDGKNNNWTGGLKEVPWPGGCY